MNDAIETIRFRLRSKIAEREKLQRRLDLLGAEIGVLEDTLALFGAEIGSAAGRSAGSSKAIGVGSSRRERSGPSKKSLSRKWVIILRNLMDQSEFGYDDIVASAEMHGQDVQRPTARSQMNIYKNQGIVDAVGSGRFCITALGREMLDAENDETPDAETSGVSEITGEGSHPSLNESQDGSNDLLG